MQRGVSSNSSTFGGGAPRRPSVALLAALSAVGPLSIDMYLPALPGIAQDLAASPAAVQRTLGLFLAGFACGQIVWGPVSDRLGRRGPLAVGLLLYGLASAACAFAGSAGELSALRFLQALGACAGPVLARAVVGDVTGREGAARLLSTLTLAVGVAPLVAPPLGAQVLALAGWRPIFLLLAGFAAVVLVLARLTLPETLPPAMRRTGPVAGVAADYLRLLRDCGFLGAVVGSAAAFGAMFAYIAAAPFVFVAGYGLTPGRFSLIFAANVAGFVGAAAVNRRLLARRGSPALLWFGNAMMLLGALALLALAAAGAGWEWILAPLFLCVASLGFIAPNAAAAALARAPRMAGTASAVLGAMQFGGGAVAGALVGLAGGASPLPMAAVMAALAAVSAVAVRLAVRRPPGAPPRA